MTATGSPNFLGVLARYHSSRTRHRIAILLALSLLILSGSLLVLHVSSGQLSQSEEDYASSSVTRWTARRFSDRQHSEHVNAQNEEETVARYRSLHQGFGRPRAALPHHNTFHDEKEQALMQQQLERQEDQLRQLPFEQQYENPSQQLQQPNQGQQHPEPLTPYRNLDSINTPAESDQSPQLKAIDGAMAANIQKSALTPAPFEETLKRRNDPTRYLTYLPYAGITNQFYGMLRGMEVAKALGRTLIIPPITSSSHDKSKQNQPWSKFLDLKRFSQLTGIKVVEFHDLRDAELTLYNEIQCRITCGFGSKRTIDFTAKGFLRQWRLNATLGPLPEDDSRLGTIVSTLEPFSRDKYLCISNTYKIVVPEKSEWERFGQHLHFTAELEAFVQQFLDKNLIKSKPKVDLDTGREIEPARHRFLAIHARRGDFSKYCEGNFAGSKMAHCLPSTEQIAERIDIVQERLNPTKDPAEILPVFVATNERNPEELRRFANLGWKYLDHEKMGTVEALGVFGPMMVDQVFMAYAETLVGIQMSTFSRVGALRQRDWYARQVEYM
ncbi:GDP-fucose protein O-fucosyltransferase-domain-containing protein [Gamsiella multidivaricata]|uniref:GDP-fucose protein O-fucosyltransferase-domain-containing protein n=1 Tax=Gamsiella multidivaricata TaxID=101098 RepID=UPI002220995E|nr:GDP-fucose protein O-fucosyltransferase-domain-containing protein [Gamsiella multidivaricata]KAG0367164.1 hypothetical protein BGZ54_004308 [Gamsiella multidivaricata]KAI7829800.1 GDP-fucose protein O-fucosyltransferase-domain-containing protein [Gamsiella multidivaricata]